MQKPCSSCPRNCLANRTEDKNIGGYCNMPLNPKVALASLHFGEEPPISGKNGSGTVFFSGCNLRCVYCQNHSISHLGEGKIITTTRLAEIFRELEKQGAHNINLVNPSHYVDAIKAALKIYRPNIPIVYNSSGYDDISCFDDDIFDIYLLDLKYISSEKSLRYSGCENYFDIASAAIKKAYRLKPNATFENGIMKSGVIIRHLILPLSTAEAIKTIDFVKENTPNAYLSLMAQYVPCGDLSKTPEIDRKITKREYEKVVDYAFKCNLSKLFLQERNSAVKDFIPIFDCSGV